MIKKLKPWISIPENSDFSIYNLPYGIFSTESKDKRIGIAIGDQVLDLKVVAESGLFDDMNIELAIFGRTSLNDYISLGKKITNEVRLRIQQELCDTESLLRNSDHVFISQSEANMHLPVEIGDYTDFYSSIEHATNVGKMFRDPENALLPNWKHLPVGYHGRASSVMVSGESIHRPKGQTKPSEDEPPVFGPCKLLDFELEMGFIVGKQTELGNSVTIKEAEDHIFGLVLFNDWSARDIQKWEYVPLGPFLGKSFASSVSAWVVPLEALEPFKVEGPKQEPKVLPYLQIDGKHNYELSLEVDILPENSSEATTITKTNFKYMYWNMAQQLAHHTVNGCNINVGDIMASGTISGPTEDSFGSMLELSWAGAHSVKLVNGEERKFLKDGDTVTMKGFAQKDDIRVGFGEVSSKILPAKN